MIADEYQVSAAAVKSGKVAVEDDLTEGMDRFQSIGVDKYLVYIGSTRLRDIDQFVGGTAVKIPIKGEMDAVFVFMLENLEIHGHRLPSFPSPDGGLSVCQNRYPAAWRGRVTPGSGEAAGSSTHSAPTQIRNHRQLHFYAYTSQIQNAASHASSKQRRCHLLKKMSV